MEVMCDEDVWCGGVGGVWLGGLIVADMLCGGDVWL